MLEGVANSSPSALTKRRIHLHTWKVAFLVLVLLVVIPLFICFNLDLRQKAFPENHVRAMVTITMDDGTIGQYSYAFPVLRNRGIPATSFLVANRTEPSSPWYVSVSQALEMQSAGWEIGSHSRTHRDLTALADQEIWDEVRGSKILFDSWGFNITSFAYPEGEYNARVLEIVSQSYNIARGVSSSNQPYDFDYLTFENRYNKLGWVSHESMPGIKALIDQTISENKWLILGFHMFYSDGRADECEDFPAIADYIQAKVGSGKLKAVNLIQGWDEWARSKKMNI